jgi:hypothetical protein
MFDQGTVSRWQQLTGRATAGPLEGARLELFPVRMVSFGTWRAAHPRGLVLAEPEESRFNYDIDPYGGYDVDHGPARRAPPRASRGWVGAAFVARLDGRDLSFTVGGRGALVERETGSSSTRWGGESPGHWPEGLPAVPQATAFWFACIHFYPDTELATTLRS